MVSGDAAFLALRTLRKANECCQEVMRMGRKLNGCRSGPTCACGALAGEMAGVCEKCRFRVRWLRRKTRHSFGSG